MNREFQKTPVLFPLFVPFAKLSHFISHKIQLFSGMSHHVQIESPALRKFPLVIAVHFLKNRGFSVNHLIMGKRKKIPFLIVILHGKGQFMIMLRTKPGLCLKITEGIVHPAQIPFVVKAQSAFADRPGDTGIIGGIFSYKHGIGEAFFQTLVHAAEKLKGGMIFSPLRLSLPVNQISHRIHSQTVKMVFLQPVAGGRLEKTAHLAAGVHKVAASPFASSHIPVRIFVQSCSVVIPQSIIIYGKVNGNKIKKHANLIAMAEIYKFLKLFWSSVAGCGGEKSGVLIAPGFI